MTERMENKKCYIVHMYIPFVHIGVYKSLSLYIYYLYMYVLYNANWNFKDQKMEWKRGELLSELAELCTCLPPLESLLE